MKQTDQPVSRASAEISRKDQLTNVEKINIFQGPKNRSIQARKKIKRSTKRSICRKKDQKIKKMINLSEKRSKDQKC